MAYLSNVLRIKKLCVYNFVHALSGETYSKWDRMQSIVSYKVNERFEMNGDYNVQYGSVWWAMVVCVW